jgi:signal peptidase II
VKTSKFFLQNCIILIKSYFTPSIFCKILKNRLFLIKVDFKLKKLYGVSLLIALSIIAIDQIIKDIFVSGYGFDGECISLVLTYNKGVAFSMFEFLGENLKWIQIAILFGILFYILKYGERNFILPTAFILGAGISNIADRFTYGGVVDYVYWHCGFDFAIFNFADVVIDFGVVWLLIISFQDARKNKVS